MRLSFLALVGYLISCVACFGEYGAYERVLYWNAYQLDAALHDRPQFISTGCTNGMPKRVKKCTFQQWLDYMDNSEGTTRITADISGMSVDRLAQELQDHRYTGKYKLHHVINGVQDTSGQMPTLFKEFSGAVIKLRNLATSIPGPNISTYLDNVSRGLSTVEYLRSVEYNKDFKTWLKDHHNIDAIMKEKQWPGMESETREFVDARATQKQHPDQNIRMLAVECADGNIHPGPIQALREAKNLLGCT